ncbi:hypothetical protein [Salipiger mucosus]|uniref:hypothetical protein n=1 Tax=Salipiger mucosus TaxID=263378 RepID=UPI0018DCEF12|nr:hypothetical protein [Salipiger mucosus]
MDQVAVLLPDESAGLEPERLEALYARLGPKEGEDVVCRAMEELAFRLGQAQRFHDAGDDDGLIGCIRALGAIADQIGMCALRRVAEDVVQCARDGDPVALAATLARLARLGERSLYAIWDLQDVTV